MAGAGVGRFVLLLRGINVGGHRRVPMADLRRVLSGLGLSDVQTYIQSGNAVFSSDRGEAELLPVIFTALQTEFGFPVAITLRTAAEFQALSSPYAAGKQTHVAFLSHTPEPERVAALQSQDFAPDLWTLIGRDLHLHYPNGTQAARLTHALIERVLNASATVRNWQTVEALTARIR
ncbi:DUF1697 domain-containing protein [Deinococcus puniceus]|uniref:DUF1697 domain-containing protein n=1 Tax=Deinococcus puniceus TaxID=1182568 RepID=A0A172T9D5_9DEIO|nr:DUF1697 domain-containing protein [Deinococcus puniceus]ANE43572.1 hypothetical protein SU48_07105 [Deinococcus puniceus]